MNISEIHIQWFGSDPASSNTSAGQSTAGTTAGATPAGAGPGNPSGDPNFTPLGAPIGGGEPLATPAPKFVGKDGKSYATQAEKDTADIAFDEAAKAKAESDKAELALRTGSDGTVYATVAEKKAADTVAADTEALGHVKEGAMENAQKVSLAAQGGAVNSAVEGAKAAGMSPAQAALMGSQQGSDVYQKQLSTNYNTQYGIEQNAASQKYAQDIAYQLGLSGQTLQKWLAENQEELSIKLAQMGIDAEQQSSIFDALGALAMGAGSLLLSDQNAKYDIHDGYGMLERVVKEVGPKVYKYKGDTVERSGIMAQDLEKTPLAHTVIETGKGKAIDTKQLTTANTAMISELSKKLDDAMAYIKKGGK
jgi:hypothetical protein